MKPSKSTSTAGDSSAALPGGFASLRRTFVLGYRAEPRLLVISLGLALLMMAPDALFALWLRMMVDAATGSDGAGVRFAALGLAISAAATWFLSVISGRYQRRFRDRVAIALESHVARLQASVATIEHHERPELLDRLAMLRDQVFALDHLFMSLFSTLGWMFRVVVTVVLLASIHPILVLLVAFALPSVWVAPWRQGVERRVYENNVVHQRLARHLFSLATTAAPAKELRVTGSAEHVGTARHAAWRRYFVPMYRARRASMLWNVTAWSIFAGAYVGAIVFVANRSNGRVGPVVLVLAAGARLARYVGATAGELGYLSGIWLDGSKRLTWLEDYAARIDEAATAAAPKVLTTGISFHDVSFRYPGTDRLVLDNVNLAFPAGSVVAIVGENGAGKSTLVKLIARMYSPTSGQICVDGTDLAAIPTNEWRDRLGGAFQDFYRFEFAAQRTVGLGSLPLLDDRPSALDAVGRAGADDVVDRLAYGLDTQLGPTWDQGVEVSFGQWQKLALARGFMRSEPLVLILDEPTSALDAETEHALFERFAAASRSAASNGRVVLLISHRFSTVRMADQIVVLDGARVAEVGSHEQLMTKGGQYASLFNIQAAAYA